VSAICPSCGASLPEDAGACSACGTPAPARGDTVAEQLPPDETGHVPIHFTSVQPRWFGIAPAAGLLVLAGISLLAAILLFVFGHWPVGLILVGLTLLLLAAFGEAAKRKPDSAFARRSFDAFRAARARAGVAVGSAAARTRAQRELAQVRHELLSLQHHRRAKVAELGEAALAGDEPAMAALKDEIGGLDELAAQKEAEMEAIATRTQEHIEQARMAVQPTMIELPEGPDDPETGPAEPPPQYPPPDEGNPPDPARIPEPYPPPEITTPESRS
jgi:hypothetical protein